MDLPEEQRADGRNTGSSFSPVCPVRFRPFQNVTNSKIFNLRWTSELFRSAGRWFYWFPPSLSRVPVSDGDLAHIKPSEPYSVPVLGGEPVQEKWF